MHRESNPGRSPLISALSHPSPPLPIPAAASPSTPRRFKRFRSLLPTTTSYRAVLSSVCIMAVLFWILHLLFFSLLPDFTTGNPSPSSPPPQEDSSVADLALQKILRDSRQIFGTYPASFNKSAASKRRAQWMTSLPDSLPLTHLRAIPGTHDSATWNFTAETRNSIPSNPSYLPAEWFRCQKNSIVEALEAGIRFFDLRYAALDTGGTDGKGDGGTRLVFWHKMALLSEVATVEDVLFGFYKWLEGRGKGEVVMVSLQYEVSFFLFFHFLGEGVLMVMLALAFGDRSGGFGGYIWFWVYVDKRGHHHHILPPSLTLSFSITILTKPKIAPNPLQSLQHPSRPTSSSLPPHHPRRPPVHLPVTLPASDTRPRPRQNRPPQTLRLARSFYRSTTCCART